MFVPKLTNDSENPTPSETDSGSFLSRRQKRNLRLKRQNKAQNKKKIAKQQTAASVQVASQKQKKPQQTVETKQRLRRATPLKYYCRLRMNNADLYEYLLQYALSDDQLLNLGYPVESAFYPDTAIIYKTPEANVTYYRSDVRTTFKSEKETFEMVEHFVCSSDASNQTLWSTEEKPPLSPSLEKRCVRCKKGFFVTLDGEYLTEESCTFHWGTFKRISASSYGYTCCQGLENSIGCSSGKLHVWSGVSPGMNGPFNNYRRSKSAAVGHDHSHSVYALDCEMCYTGCGLEVCKVTVISIDGCLVYETLVKPERAVVDCNTRYSGIREADLKGAKKSLRDVQDDLLASFIFAETILIGHGLENDLRSLGLLHSNVIDTAVLFPHYYGFPFRRSLKSLVATYLQRDIQKGPDGHDSFEDARACAELVLWKVASELRPKSEHHIA